MKNTIEVISVVVTMTSCIFRKLRARLRTISASPAAAPTAADWEGVAHPAMMETSTLPTRKAGNPSARMEYQRKFFGRCSAEIVAWGATSGLSPQNTR